jgi:hypothetical protein
MQYPQEYDPLVEKTYGGNAATLEHFDLKRKSNFKSPFSLWVVATLAIIAFVLFVIGRMPKKTKIVGGAVDSTLQSIPCDMTAIKATMEALKNIKI